MGVGFVVPVIVEVLLPEFCFVLLDLFVYFGIEVWECWVSGVLLSGDISAGY